MDANDWAAKLRADFLQDVGRAPLTQVRGMVDSVTFLSPAERDGLTDRADALHARRLTRIKRFLDEDLASFTDRAERQRDEAADVVTELRRLTDQAQAGQVDHDEFNERFSMAEHRLRNVRRNRDGLPAAVEEIRVKEEEPERWLAELEAKYPQIREGVGGPNRPLTGDPSTRDWSPSA